MTEGRVFWFGATGLFGLMVFVYAWQASGTPLLNSDLAKQRHYLDAVAESATGGPVASAEAADAYWLRYPDVAKDAYYGRNGPLGYLGARQHFHDHGRREGRRWDQ